LIKKKRKVGERNSAIILKGVAEAVGEIHK